MNMFKAFAFVFLAYGIVPQWIKPDACIVFLIYDKWKNLIPKTKIRKLIAKQSQPMNRNDTNKGKQYFGVKAMMVE